SMLTSRMFVSAVGLEVTTARSEIKRKLQNGATKKLDIVVLGKNLAWNNTQEMTDEFWGRMAWIQFFLLEHEVNKTKNPRAFWDDVDENLAERREKAQVFPEEERALKAGIIFEEALKAHTQMFPLKRGGKLRAGKQMPEWQRAISRAVAEMEAYTLEDLAGEEDPADGDDQDGPGPLHLDFHDASNGD
ncbi:hypothetical protein K438DRAFT_1823888, partial [Mycena galopus ATCC 62051]